MVPLLIVFTPIVLLTGFLGLTKVERERETRFFEAGRRELDRQVIRARFIMEHVDFAGFVKDELRHFAERIGHDIVNGSLQGVRAAERLLTRLIRRFRVREAATALPRENARAFVKTLADFKEQLQTNLPPEVTEVP